MAGDPVPHSLGECYGRYLDPSFFYKETEMSFSQYKEFKEANQTSNWSGELNENQIRYAAEDVCYIFYLLEQQFIWLDEYKRRQESNNKSKESITKIISMELSLIPVVSHSELRGMPYDRKYHENIIIPTLVKYNKEAKENVNFYREIEVKKANRWCILKTKEELSVRGKKRFTWLEIERQAVNINSPIQLKTCLNEFLIQDLGEGDVPIKIKYKEKEEPKVKVLNGWIGSTAEDTIKDFYYKNLKILSEESKDKIQWTLQYKKSSSLMSKFGNPLLKFITDRGYIHPNALQIGSDESAVVSGRFAYSKPNIQQIPAKEDLFKYSKYGSVIAKELFRNGFCAKDGWKIVCADYSQIEVRIGAEVCNEKGLIKRYQDESKGLDKVDIHAITAKSLMNLDFEPSGSDPDPKIRFLRNFIGKTAGLSLLFWKHWTTLKDFMFTKTDGVVEWTDEEAEEKYNNYFKAFPGFKQAQIAWERIVRQKPEEFGFSLAFAKKVVDFFGRVSIVTPKTMTGRPRKFPLKAFHFYLPDECLQKDHKMCEYCVKKDKKGILVEPKYKNYNIYRSMVKAAITEGFNHRIQGTAADMLKLAAVKVHNKLIENNFPLDEGIIGFIHDEILLHVREERAELAKRLLEEGMMEAGAEILEKVPVKVDCGIGITWAGAKP
jgi:DNA polymerase I-like protein with 3'-5' exonuclease and polymerase domains